MVLNYTPPLPSVQCLSGMGGYRYCLMQWVISVWELYIFTSLVPKIQGEIWEDSIFIRSLKALTH